MLEKWLRHWADKGYGECVISFGGLDARMYLDVERLNLGYCFGPMAWGLGHATELGRAALSFWFDELDVPQVFAVVRPSYRASINVLKKIDMRRIDTLDRCARTGDEFCVLGQS